MKRLIVQKKKINILIPNGTSPRNIGDVAILTSLLDTINKRYPNSKITIHSFDPELYRSNQKYKIKHTLYSWIRTKSGKVSLLFRLIQLVMAYPIYKYNLNFLHWSSGIFDLLNDYKQADLIIFVGNGYIRTHGGIKQSLNLLMQLSLFEYSKLFNSKRIITPISFGPFAYKWEEKISARSLKGFNIIAAREEISFKIMKKNRTRNLIISSDFGFFVRKFKIKKPLKRKPLAIGFTVRNWLSELEQEKFEKTISQAIIMFSKISNCSITPIIQVKAPKYGEDDSKATKNIVALLKKNQVYLNKTKTVKNLSDAKKIYSNVDLLIGMRMHSNIIAATQGTPFIAISYEHKTQGIMKKLNLEEYCLKCEDLDAKVLFRLIKKLHNNKIIVKQKIKSSIKKIQYAEKNKWIFSILPDISI